jgi:5-methylcytosine-specific restriction enzyme A
MTHRRAEFSAETKRQAFRRSGGICECHRIPHVFPQPCGCALVTGAIFYEHINPSQISGRNDLDNAAALTKTCWRIKTSTHDLPVIAKVKRVADRVLGIRPTPRQRLPGGRGDPFKLKIGGGVVDRRTGEPWRGWR